MLRAILVGSTAATVMLVIAAVFFCDQGDVAAIDREARKQYDLGKPEEALATLEAGLKRFPDSPKLNYGLGTLLAARGNLKEGQRRLEYAAAVSPETPEYHKELGICYLQADRPTDAERELKTVLKLNDKWPEAHFYLGLVYERQGKSDLAMEEYVKEVNVNSCCTFAWAKIFEADKSRTEKE